MDRLDDLSLIVPYLSWKYNDPRRWKVTDFFFLSEDFLSLNFNMHLPEHGSANRLTRDLNSVSFQELRPPLGKLEKNPGMLASRSILDIPWLNEMMKHVDVGELPPTCNSPKRRLVGGPF